MDSLNLFKIFKDKIIYRFLNVISIDIDKYLELEFYFAHLHDSRNANIYYTYCHGKISIMIEKQFKYK